MRPAPSSVVRSPMTPSGFRTQVVSSCATAGADSEGERNGREAIDAEIRPQGH